MAAILQCIIRTCLDNGDESGGSGSSGSSRPPTSRTMARSSSDSVGQYSPATIHDPHDSLAAAQEGLGGDIADAGRCCATGVGGAPLGAADTLEQEEDFVQDNSMGQYHGLGAPGRGLHGLFARLGFVGGGGGGGGYGSLVQAADAPPSSHVGLDAGSSTPRLPVRESPSVSSAGRSPLRSASSFDYDKNMRSIPSIQLDEIVMPGSDLQKQMSAIMAKDIEEDVDDECVICLEGFTAENPRMPTLCGCGENKTYFHLPCLYQWIEQDRNCPSCRERLRWEEF